GTSSSNPMTGGGSATGNDDAPFLGDNKDKSEDNPAGGMIQADPATNSLIITAPDAVYRNLRSVINQLDARRAQVYIEALIVELNSDTNANLGIQWQIGSGNVLAGTNLATGNGNSIINVTSAALAAGATGGVAGALAGSNLQQGLNVGWVHNLFGVQGLGALLQALSQTSDANVLSTPNLITLDNQEAKIVVGTNVPIQTGSYSNLTSSTASSAFNTYDRVDVGLTLHIKPQITEGGILKLTLYTEDSAIVTGTTNVTTNPAGPDFTKRSIQSTVLADNGEIIVLGGLMQDNYQVSNSKVPLLGDIPWIGQLFRSENKTRTKTNLMVFLRPVIIGDSDTARAVTSNRYDYIQGVTGAYKSDNNLIKDNDDPVVPPMPVGPNEGGSTLNLFDLDKMRREQATRTLPAAPAAAGATSGTSSAGTAGGVNSYAVPTNGAAQPQPVQPAVPVQTLPAQPLLTTPGAQQ
ncbi:type II secretion system secretin GspD, partial [Paraburkholderia acidipaludis]|uniref:type II secretion system secretin GspD n=1 Tax=Paraburkholderia acidipaludis TaxID=660537 RepID=UPI0005B8F256